MRVMSYVQQRKKNLIYELRYPVPDELRGIVGKQYHYKSLGTREKADANRRGSAEIERFEAYELAAARKKLEALGRDTSHSVALNTTPVKRAVLDPAEVE